LEIRGVEGGHLDGGFFGYTVTPEELVGKEDHDFWDVEMACYKERT